MKKTSLNEKAISSCTNDTEQRPSSGPDGSSLTPPAYGIQSLDHSPRESTPEPGTSVQRQAAVNRTGLPDALKSGVESLSGLAMDDVRVHYNSSQPANLQALAYAQGTDIHVAPGQERHVPHEAWHVVQQKQGRVKPMMQMKDGVPVNDDKGLEHEADLMGVKVLSGTRHIHRSDTGVADGVVRHGGKGRQTAYQKRINRENTVAQRMVVNIGRKNLAELDWVTLSTIGFALDESGFEQMIVNLPKADFSKVGLTERIYLVGHGTGVQTVGNLKEDAINQLGLQLKKSLPEHYMGDIVAMNCRAGQIPEGVGMSGIEMLGRAMGRPNIPVYGPMGKSYSHSVLVPQVLDPKKEKDQRPEYDDAKNKIGQEWKKMVDDIHKKDIKDQAMIAKEFTHKFYGTQIKALGVKGMLLEKGWWRYGK